MIKEILDSSSLWECVSIIRSSFSTVAADLNLTYQNCPTNAAFIRYENLLELKKKGVRFFGKFDSGKLVGLAGLEKAEGKEGKVYYLEKLCVLPEFRHKGIGRDLMDFSFELVRNEGGEIISIAVIDENIVLKNWYKEYGFVETSTRKFEQLPFIVCFMEKRVE